MEYTHSSEEDRRQFVAGRLRALEQEHFGYALLVEDADPDDPQVQAWRSMMEATERNIEKMRKGLQPAGRSPVRKGK